MSAGTARPPHVDPPHVGGETSPGPSVVVHDVGVAIGTTQLLAGVSFAVARGGWLALLGPNGAGKTTLLRAMAGVVSPTNGRIVVDGLEVASSSPRDLARRVALVDQRPTLPPGMAVADYVLLGRNAHVRLLGSEGPRDLDVVAEAMARLDVARFADRDVLTLSGGEAQRVVVARALAQEASVLLLDEPTTALDLAHQHHVLELVDDLRRERGLTVVSSLHDLTVAGQFAVDAVLLSDGEVMASGPVAQVLRPDAIERAYGASVRVLDDGSGGVVVVPLRADRPADPTPTPPTPTPPAASEVAR